MRKLLLLLTTLIASLGAGAQCISSFSASPNPSGNNLLNVNFLNSSTYGLPFSGQRFFYQIEYGDGNTTSGYSLTLPSHVYSSTGTYTATLVIKSVDSATGTVTCRDSSAITFTLSYPSCGTTIAVAGTGTSRTFTASTPAGSSGMTYSWTYGDGGTGTGSPVSHTYATSGTYNVTLTATRTSPACTYTNTMQVTIYVPPATLNCGTLQASFTTSVSSNTLATTNTSSVRNAPYVMTATWDYGDGGTASGFSPPSHNYTSTGVYTVKLRMVWSDSMFTFSCRDSTTRTVTITSVPAPPNVISGFVIYDTTAGKNYFKVWLYKYDSASSLYSAVDSQITGSVGIPYYAFGGRPAGAYLTMAAVYGPTAGTYTLVPTYYDSSVYWSSAMVINHTGGSSINKRIYMRSGTLGTGTGTIGGNIRYTAGAGGVLNRMVFLRNATMRVVKIAYTDAAGDYSFPNIPLGAYSVWPEFINYYTTPATPIVINNVVPGIWTINFDQDNTLRTIKPRTTGVNTPGALNTGLQLMPVPAHSEVMVSWTGAAGAAGGLFITTATGQVVKNIPDVNVSRGHHLINVADLAAGIYFVRGTGALSGIPAKLVIE